jgi:hypothetical protein
MEQKQASMGLSLKLSLEETMPERDPDLATSIELEETYRRGVKLVAIHCTYPWVADIKLVNLDSVVLLAKMFEKDVLVVAHDIAITRASPKVS